MSGIGTLRVKIPWAIYCSRTILDSPKQTKWYLWVWNLFTSSFHNISPKNNPHHRHITQLKKAFEKYNRELVFEVLQYLILIVMWIQLILSFTELVTRNPMQICSWIFSKHFQNKFLSDSCGRSLSCINFHNLKNRRLLKRCS